MHRHNGGEGFTTPQASFTPMSTTPSNAKTEEFERFMATSIRAFDAMMDAVKGDGERESYEFPGSPGEDELSLPRSSLTTTPLRSHHQSSPLPPTLSGLADNNTVAIVGNEDMVQQVARAYAQASAMDDQISADNDTLEWYKERIAYLEGVRTDLVRDLEHERHDCQYQRECFEQEKAAMFKQFEEQLDEERSLRVDAEERVRRTIASEIKQAEDALILAREREEESATKLGAIEVKVSLLQSERAELLHDRDAAKDLLAAHEADMDKLEQTLLSLQMQQRIGNGLLQAGSLMKGRRRRGLGAAFQHWKVRVAAKKQASRLLVSAGCSHTAGMMRTKRRHRLRSAWTHMRRCVVEGRFAQEQQNVAEQFDIERSGIIAERAAAHQALENQRTEFAVNKASSMVRSFRQAALSKGWRTWLDFHAASVAKDKQRRNEGSSIFALTKRLRLKKLSQWFLRLYRQTSVATTQQIVQQVELKRQEEVRALVVSRATTLLSSRAQFSASDRLRCAMMRWGKAVQVQLLGEKVLKRALRMMSSFALQMQNACFKLWTKTISLLKAQEARKQQGMKLLLRLASSGIEADKAKTIFKWRMFVNEKNAENKLKQEKDHQLMMLVLSSMHRRAQGLLGEGWHVWVGFVSESKKKQQRAAELALAALRRLSRMGLTKGWGCWQAYVASAKMRSSRRRASLHAGGAGLRTMRRTLASRSAKQLKKAIRKWCEVCSDFRVLAEENRKRDFTIANFTRKMMSQKVLSGWRTWIAMVEEKKRIDLMLKSVLQRLTSMEHRLLILGFTHWIRITEVLALEAQQASQAEVYSVKFRNMMITQGSDRLRITTRNMVKNQVRKAWLKWRYIILIANKSRVALVHFASILQCQVSSMDVRRLQVAFQKLRRTSHSRQSLRLVVGKGKVRCERSGLRSAWWSWLAVLRRGREAAVTLKRASAVGHTAMRFLSYKLNAAWRTWIAETVNLRQQQMARRHFAMNKYFGLMVSKKRRVVAAAMHSWLYFLRVSREKERKLQERQERLLVNSKRFSMQKVYMAWKTWLHRHRQLSHILEACLLYKRCVERRALCKWKRRTLNQKAGLKLGRRLAGLVSKFFNLLLHRAWGRWVAVSTHNAMLSNYEAEMTRLKATSDTLKLKRVARRIVTSQEARGFGTWVKMVAFEKLKQRSALVMMKLMLRRMGSKVRSALLGAWRSWVQHLFNAELLTMRCALEMSNASNSTHLLHDKVARGGNTLEKFFQHRHSLLRRRAFGVWRKCLEDATLMLRCFRRLATRTLFAGFEAWRFRAQVARKHLQKVNRSMELFGRAVRSMEIKAKSKALSQWRTASWTLFMERTRDTEMKKRLFEKTIRTMVHSLLGKSFRLWVHCHRTMVQREEALRRNGKIMRKVSLRVLNSRLTSALRTWNLFVIAQNQTRAAKKRALRTLFVRVEKAVVGHAFKWWRWHHNKTLDNDDLLQRTLALAGSSSLRLIHSYFRHWDTCCQNAAAVEHLVPKLVSKVWTGMARQALAHWRSFNSCIAEEEAVAKSVKSAFAITKRFMSRMQQSSMSRGFRCWLHHYRSSLNEQSKLVFMKKCGARLWSKKCAYSWTKWHSLLLQTRLIQAKFTKQLKRKLARLLRVTMMQWRRFNVVVREAEASATRDRKTMTRSLLFLGRSKKISAFTLWAQCVRSLKLKEESDHIKSMKMKTQFSKFGIKLEANLKGCGFRHWRDVILHLKTQEVKSRLMRENRRQSVCGGVANTNRFLKHLNQRGLARAFRTWHKVVMVIMARGRQRCLLMLTMMEDSVKNLMRMAWRKWTHVLDLLARRAVVVTKVCTKQLRSTLRLSLMSWRNQIVEMKERDRTWKLNGRLLVSVLRKLVSSAKLSGWLRWRAIDSEMKHAQLHKIQTLSRLKKVISHIGLQELSLGFRTWHRVVAEAVTREANVAKKVNSFVKMMQGKNNLVLGRYFRLLRRQSDLSKFAMTRRDYRLKQSSAVAHRMLAAMTKRDLLAAFNKWRHGAAHLSQFKVGLYMMRKLFGSATVRMLSKGFRSWKQLVVEVVRTRRDKMHRASIFLSQAGALMNVQHRGVESKYFNKWRRLIDPLIVSPAVRCARLIHTHSSVVILRQKSRCWLHWKSYVSNIKFEVGVQQQRGSAAARVAGSRLVHRWLVLAFSKWRHVSVNKQINLIAVRGAVAALSHLLKSAEYQKKNAFFKLWIRVVKFEMAAEKNKNAKLRICASRVVSGVSRLLGAALHTWYAHVLQYREQLKEEEAAAAKQKQKMRRIMNRCTVNGPLQMAVNQWKKWVDHARTQDRVEEALGERSSVMSQQRRQQIILLTLANKDDAKKLYRMSRAWKVMVANVTAYHRTTECKVRSSKLFGSVFNHWQGRRLSVAFRTWLRLCHQSATYLHKVEEKLTLCSRSITSMLKASIARAFYQWKSARLAMDSVLEVQSSALHNATLKAVLGGVRVVERIERKRCQLRLRSCLDRWFIAAHSKEIQVVSASRALQLLFAIDMRLLQRSYMRWRAVEPRVRLNPVTPARPSSHFIPPRSVDRTSSPVSEILSPLSDSLNSKTPTGFGSHMDSVFRNSDSEEEEEEAVPTTPFVSMNGVQVWHSDDMSSHSTASKLFKNVPFDDNDNGAAAAAAVGSDTSTSVALWPSGPVSVNYQEEVGHFRRLLWAHLHVSTSGNQAWRQGRKSVLIQSQKSVSRFLLRRLQNKKLWTSFSHWRHVVATSSKAIAHRRSSQTSACKTTVNIFKAVFSSKLRKAFNSWTRFINDGLVQEAAVRRRQTEFGIGLRITSRLSRRMEWNKKQHAMRVWCKVTSSNRYTVKQRRSSIMSLSGMLGRGTNEQTKRAFFRWRVFSQMSELELRQRQRLMKRTMSYFNHANSQRAFNTWRAVVRDMIVTGEKIRKVCLHLIHRSIYLGFTHWKMVHNASLFAEKAVGEAQHSARRVISRVLHGTLVLGFSHWRTQVRKCVEGQQVAAMSLSKMHNVVLSLQKRSLLQGWNTWTQVVSSQKWLSKKFISLALNWQMSNLRSALSHWQRIAAYRTRRGRELRLSFRVCGRVMRSGELKAQDKAFRKWRWVVNQAAHDDDMRNRDNQLLHTRRVSTIKFAKKALSRMFSFALSSAMKKWQAVVLWEVQELQRQAGLQMKFGTMLCESVARTCHRALLKWKVVIKELRIAQHYNSNMDILVQQHMAEAASLRAVAQAHELKLQSRAMGMLKSFASGTQARSVARAFNTWRRVAQQESARTVEQNRQIAVQVHVLRLMMSNAESEVPRLLSIAWTRWRKAVHNEKLKLKQIHLRLVEVASTWMQKRETDQRVALRRWHAATTALRLNQGERRLRMRAALHMLVSVTRRNLTRAWGVWCQSLLGSRIENVLTIKVSHLTNACLVANTRFGDVIHLQRAWRKWRLFNLTAGLAVKSKEQASASLNKTILRVLKLNIGKAFLSWVEFSKRCRMRQLSVNLFARCFGRFIKASLCKGWRTWRLFTWQQIQISNTNVIMKRAQQHHQDTSTQLSKQLRRRSMLSVTSTMVAKSKGQAWLIWLKFTSKSRSAELAAKHKEVRLRMTLDSLGVTAARCQLSMVGNAFHKWQMFNKLKLAFLDTSKSLASLELMRAETAQRAFDDRFCLAVSKLQWCIKSSERHSIRVGFVKWFDYIAKKKRIFHMVRKVFAGSSKRSLFAGFGKWKLIADRSKKSAEYQALLFERRKHATKVLSRATAKVLRSWSQLQQSQAFRHLVRAWQTHKQLHDSRIQGATIVWRDASIVMNKWSQKQVLRAFNKWAEDIMRAKMLSTKKTSAATSMWRGTRGVMKRWSQKQVLRAFNKWAEDITRAKLASERRSSAATSMWRGTRGVMKRWSQKQVLRAFNKWVSEVLLDRMEEESSFRRRDNARTKSLAKGFYRWTEDVALQRQREEHIDSSIELLKDKCLSSVLMVSRRIDASNTASYFHRWLSIVVSMKERESVLTTLLSTALANGRRLIGCILLRSFGKWAMRARAERDHDSFKKQIDSGKVTSRAWRLWMTQVWSRRYLLLKELYARKSLEELKKLKELTESELEKVITTLRVKSTILTLPLSAEDVLKAQAE